MYYIIFEKMLDKSEKKAYTTYKFFKDMKIIRGEIYRVLKPEGKAVFKTSKSYYQRVLVPTSKFLTLSGKRIDLKKLYIFNIIRSHIMITHFTARDGVVMRDRILGIKRWTENENIFS